jgi:3-deoxy-D-manno-octulosonic-acid transferase
MAAQRRAIPGFWAYRLGRGRRRGDRAQAPAPPAGRAAPIWLHATDAEAAAVLALLARQIGELRGAPPTVLTGTAADPGPSDAPEDAAAQLDRFAPAMLVLSGAPLPPALVEAARRRGLPILLVNARRPVLPGQWRLWPGFLRGLLGAMSEIHAADAASATLLRGLAPAHVPVEATGPLALYPPAPPCNASELEAMRATLSHRQCWFAWSLPPPEEAAALLAHVQALRRAHRLLLIVSPRDPGRGADLAERARDVGFVIARRALDEEITETTQVYIADAEDEPGLFLRLAGICFLGGSLTRDAGTPAPLLAASLGSALVFGPHAADADRAFLDRLHRARAARRIATTSELGDAIAALLAPEIGAEAALRAWSIATEGSDATDALARRIGEAARAATGPRG